MGRLWKWLFEPKPPRFSQSDDDTLHDRIWSAPERDRPQIAVVLMNERIRGLTSRQRRVYEVLSSADRGSGVDYLQVVWATGLKYRVVKNAVLVLEEKKLVYTLGGISALSSEQFYERLRFDRAIQRSRRYEPFAGPGGLKG